MFSKLLKKALGITVHNRAMIEYNLTMQIAKTIFFKHQDLLSCNVTEVSICLWLDKCLKECMEVLWFLGLSPDYNLFTEITEYINSLGEKYIIMYNQSG